MCQPHYPFECALDGVAVREAFAGEECVCDRRITEPHQDHCQAGEEGDYEDGLAGNDVFRLEGPQERYGHRDAWNAAER